MNLRKLLRILAGGSQTGGDAAVDDHGTQCPYESEVLAYMEGSLAPSRREQLDTHFADCGECLEFFALFVRASTEPGEMLDNFSNPPSGPTHEREVRNQSVRVLAMIEEDDLSHRAVQSRETLGEQKGFYISLPRLAWTAVALIVVTVGSILLFVKTNRPDQVAMEALAEAVRTERRTPARISGGFAYSPHPVTRGGADNNSSLHFERAFSQLRAAEKPSAPVRERLTLARAYLARNASGDASRARTILEEIASIGDQSLELDNDIGVAFFHLENYESALTSFKTALGRNPESYEALFNKALVEERLKLYTDARTDWELFIESSPDPEWRQEAQQNLDLLKQIVR